MLLSFLIAISKHTSLYHSQRFHGRCVSVLQMCFEIFPHCELTFCNVSFSLVSSFSGISVYSHHAG
nr:MAG TPA: hypothetical protein [Caudoviricetes sp.]